MPFKLSMMAKSCDFGFTRALPVDKVIGIVSDWLQCPGMALHRRRFLPRLLASVPLISSNLFVAILFWLTRIPSGSRGVL